MQTKTNENLAKLFSLEGKVAAVTGAGGGLFGAVARGLADLGVKIAALDLRLAEAQKTADDIIAAGGDAIGIATDVLKTESVAAARDTVLAKYGRVDILINGAGGNNPKGTTSKEFLFPEDLQAAQPGVTTFFDLDPQGVQFVFNLNFIGTLLPTQVFARAMAERGAGAIVNISSMNAFTPLTKIPAYSAAKAAVSNFTQWLAVHMSKVGIRVNAIAPGFFLTDQNRGLLTQADGSWTARGNTILTHTPMGRFGVPEDLLGALLWLVNEEGAAFVTGTVIPVDGGFSSFSGV